MVVCFVFLFAVMFLTICFLIVFLVCVVNMAECTKELILIVIFLVIMILFFCNKFNECVCIDFPVYMYSYVKFTRFSDRVDFCETVVVTLIKKRC